MYNSALLPEGLLVRHLSSKAVLTSEREQSTHEDRRAHGKLSLECGKCQLHSQIGKKEVEMCLQARQ